MIFGPNEMFNPHFWPPEPSVLSKIPRTPLYDLSFDLLSPHFSGPQYQKYRLELRSPNNFDQTFRKKSTIPKHRHWQLPKSWSPITSRESVGEMNKGVKIKGWKCWGGARAHHTPTFFVGVQPPCQLLDTREATGRQKNKLLLMNLGFLNWHIHWSEIWQLCVWYTDLQFVIDIFPNYLPILFHHLGFKKKTEFPWLSLTN